MPAAAPPDPGAVRFRVHTAPPPDDALLSPLTDPRASAIELRDGKVNMTLATGRFDALPAGNTPNIDLDLGSIGVSEPRDLRMLALGTAGQQVLGLALSRNVAWGYGKETEVVLELRRPLVFFGGSGKLIALDAGTGTVLKEIELGPVFAGPSLSRGRVYVGGGNTLFSPSPFESFFPKKYIGTVRCFGLPGEDEVDRLGKRGN